ncbi:MAG: type II secretion system protein GspJ, partial [Dehalococcoidia bacterium]|nr:type II secretion system protein GspJ [Dehalococcoidia bacterium]
ALRHDLLSLRRFDPLPFEGAPEEFSAAGVDRDHPEAPVEELGRLGYYFERRERRLCRSFVPFRVAARERLKTRCEAMLEDVDDVNLSYLSGPGATGGWVDRWREPDPPWAVRLTVTGSAATGGDAHTLVVALPRLGPLPEEQE